MNGVFDDPSFMRRWTLRLGFVWISMLYFRVAWVSHAELEAADLARGAGQIDVAIAHYRRAARHAAPPFDASAKAYDALFEIGAAADRVDDSVTALSAYRSVRGSIVAGRPLGTFQGERLERADERIAAIVSRNDRGSLLRDQSPEVVRRMHRTSLQEEPRERWLGLALTVFGFILFVASAHELVSRGFDVDDRPIRETLMRAALSIALGFGVFIAGLLIT